MAAESSPKKRKQNYDIPNLLTVNGIEAATKEDLNNATISGSYYPGEYLGYTGGSWGNLNSIKSFNDSSAYDVALDMADGTLWLSTGGSNEIVHLDRDGNLINFFTPSVGGSCYGIDIDREDGGIWFTDQFNDAVYKIDQSGNHLLGPIANPYPSDGELKGVTVDISDGSIWVSISDTMVNMNRSGNVIYEFGGLGGDFMHITLDHYDGTFYATNQKGEVIHMDRLGNDILKQTYSADKNTLTGISFDPADGNIWVVDSIAGIVDYVRWED